MGFSVPMATAGVFRKLYRCFQLLKYMQEVLGNPLAFSSLEHSKGKGKIIPVQTVEALRVAIG
jgi:hypothetical protein